MNKEEIKNELMNRFMYINENSIYILAPYLKKKKLKGIKRLTSDWKDLIYLEYLPNDLLKDLESFLLSDMPFNEIDSKNNHIPFEDGDFINFIADISNHYNNNLSILTEDEKQSVYSKVRVKRF